MPIKNPDIKPAKNILCIIYNVNIWLMIAQFVVVLWELQLKPLRI